METMSGVSSLASLKARLDKRSSRISPTASQEVTDHRTWIEKIGEHGNKPEDWLDFLRFLQQKTAYSGMKRCLFLSTFFDKALKAISPEDNRKNEAFAQIFVDFAHIKGDLQPTVVDEMLSYGRCTCKNAAVLYVASAEIKLKLANPEKARNILLKGQQVDAQPARLLSDALQLLKEGKTELLPRFLEHDNMTGGIYGHSSKTNTMELLFSGDTSENNTGTTGLAHVERLEPAPLPKTTSLVKLNNNTKTLSQETGLDVMDHKDVNILDKGFSSWSNKLMGSSLLPVEKDNADDKALDGQVLGTGHKVENWKAPSVCSHQTPHISDKVGGKHVPGVPGPSCERQLESMEISHKTTLDSERHRHNTDSKMSSMSASHSDIPNNRMPSSTQKHSSYTNLARRLQEFQHPPDHEPEMDTAPVNASEMRDIETMKDRLANSCRPALRKYSSSPNIREGGPKFQSWRSSRNLLPLRVKKTQNLLPPAEVDENDDTLSQIKPLEESPECPTPSARTSGHTSGYISMNEMHIEQNAPLLPLNSLKSKEVQADQVPPAAPVQMTSQKNQVSSEAPPVRKVLSEIQSNTLEKKPRPSSSVKEEPVKEVQPPPKSQQAPQMEVICVNHKPYTVIQCIGMGGSSKVYKVLDTSTFSILALKVVRLEDTKEQIVEGYRNEISLLKRLQYCPKVIHLYDFEIRDDEKRLYILMESGDVDLDQYMKNKVKQEGKLSPLDVKYHWRSMLQAVAALHKEGIIHSDLKPSNFLLIKGELKLIDFGIAKAIQQDKTSIITDCQVGTLNYMSPETIQENCGVSDPEGKAVFKIGVKSDVWSLGCILYNMVYGHTPFQKIMRQFAKLQAIINPNHVIDFPDIPDKRLLEVMKRCLNRDPKQRPSIEELLSDEYMT